jgi:L-fuconolactonase
MRLDAHQHFWRYDAKLYDWIGEGMHVLRRDFVPEDLAHELAAAGLDGSIAVQARQDLAETRELLEFAHTSPVVRGVVGWLDLCSETLGAQLDEFAGDTALLGVRHIVQDEPDDNFLLRPDFVRGALQLRERGLTYDILIYAKHLPVARQFAEQLSEQPLVLDHLAKPPIAAAELEPWATHIRALARCENVMCKVSGMVTEANWGEWKPADFRPFLDVVFEAFGTDRLMFGSDWPVCLLAANYGEVYELVREYAGSDQDALFGGNAARFYGVDA